MRKKDVIALFGSAQAVADALEVTRAAIGFWKDIIPEGSAYKLQVITGGRLRVDPAVYRDRPKRGQTLHTAA